jgi:tetratricopeptide (TPR) repeat protein
MKLKLTLFIVLIALGVKIVSAQSESDGFSKLDKKEYSGAKKIFLTLVNTNPKNAAALYGLGECYYFTGKTDSAKISYQKGLDASSSYAGNYAGMGKVSMLSAPADAENYFKDAVKKSKKDATAIIAIANYYYSQTPRKLDDAKRYIDMAIGVDSKNASAYYLNGLIEVERSNTGAASLQLEQAIYFNPNLFEAYFAQSAIMAAARNFPQAIEYVNKVIAINPNYWIAYKNLGELYYNNQKYADAAKNFAIYFKNVPTDNDVTHYAYSLFFDKQFDKARELMNKLINKNPNDYVPLRLLGYISYETKDYVNGKGIMDKFFTLIPADKVMTDDLSYYGKMLSASGKDSLAIVNYLLALKKDSTQYQIYDELAKSSNKLKKYEQALKYNQMFVNKKPNVAISDYFVLGRTYYSTANSLNVKKDTAKIVAPKTVALKTDSLMSMKLKTDSLKQLKYFTAADSIFAKVETLSPTSYLGTFWRARVNSAIDKETTRGLAKPFYEKALIILQADTAKYKKEISEAYSYLGFYYYLKDDKAASIDYWKKLLQLDPANTKAAEAINMLEKKK